MLSLRKSNNISLHGVLHFLVLGANEPVIATGFFFLAVENEFTIDQKASFMEINLTICRNSEQCIELLKYAP